VRDYSPSKKDEIP